MAATNVIHDSYPAGLELPSPPLSLLTGTIFNNAFNVSSDRIIRADFSFDASQFSFGIFSGSPPNDFLIRGAGPNLAVRSNQFPSFVAVPEAPTWALLLLGFAGLAFPARRAARRAPAA